MVCCAPSRVKIREETKISPGEVVVLRTVDGMWKESRPSRKRSEIQRDGAV